MSNITDSKKTTINGVVVAVIGVLTLFSTWLTGGEITIEALSATGATILAAIQLFRAKDGDK